jgi:GNAT superfamily N-acetyltransferase
MPVLRPMSHADLDALLDIQREASVLALGRIFPQAEHPFPGDEIRERWSREIESDDVDCFVGTSVPVWGSGLAGAAHDEILEHLREKGFAEAWLRVFAENHRARRFYEQRGWLATGERTRTQFAPHPVLLSYARPLVPAS